MTSNQTSQAFVECKQIIITPCNSRELSSLINLGSLLECCSNKSLLMIRKSSKVKYYFIANDLRDLDFIIVVERNKNSR